MAVVYLVSIATPSIWGPLQVVGATAGAIIGFIAPGMLALLPTDAQLTRQVALFLSFQFCCFSGMSDPRGALGTVRQ